nr:DDE-type integrase/transposase/recombinase [Burkholderia glumae]
MPLAFEPGEAFQFDWSCEYAFVGGLRRRLEVAHVKLNSSRAFWLVAYPTQSHEMLFDAHARAFAAFGGVPRRGIYDNMKTAVDKVGRGKARGQRALRSNVQSLPVRARVLQPCRRLGERHRREERSGPATSDLARSSATALGNAGDPKRMGRWSVS